MRESSRSGGRRRPGRARLVVAVVTLLLGIAGCDAPEPGEVTTPDPESTTSEAEPRLSDADLWLSFESDAVAYDGSTEFPDALGGPFAGRVVTANGGRIQRVPGVDGDAVAFPARCSAAHGCPRAMVEVLPDPALDPGTSDFEYGAAVWLAPDQTTTGSNIVQKGRFATEGGLWKLQVDDDAGRPSCVVRSGTDQLLVRSSVSIADSAWHVVVCRRDGEGLSIRVDGAVDRVAGRTGAVTNDWPIRIGSPGVGDADDQFHGRVDDVFLSIDPAP